MPLGLSSLFTSLFSLTKATPQKSRPIRRRCRLLGEQLETRYALAGDVIAPIDPLPAPTQDIPAEEAPSNPGSSCDDAPPIGGTVETPPTNSNQAPVITSFIFVLEGAWLTISGSVMDDQDPTGYIIQLTGILNGSIEVGVDDQFSQVFAWDPDVHGTVFGITQDAAGLISTMVSIAF